MLGQKWGIRRYQNPDGSLTEAGKHRYSYGSVNVEHLKGRNGEPSTVRIWNKEKEVEISKKSFQELERLGEAYVVNMPDSVGNTSLKEAKRLVIKNKDTLDFINEIVDASTESKLTSVLDQYGTTRKHKSPTNRTQADNKNSNKSKYTQEQAIDKVYDELEKKYPNFSNLSQDRQDKLFFEYAENSGLAEYIFD